MSYLMTMDASVIHKSLPPFLLTGTLELPFPHLQDILSVIDKWKESCSPLSP